MAYAEEARSERRQWQETGRHAPYLLFMLLASLFALVVLGADTFGEFDESTRTILSYADFVLCGLFLIDFGVSLYRAEDKLRYLATWGWLDLISSIPVLDSLRWGRGARMIRIARLLRGIRSARILAQFILEQRAQSGLMAASMLLLLLITVGSIGILHAERQYGEMANIQTGEDAVWWSVATVTTVGYGDKFPLSSEGRLIAAALMFGGVGMFGTLSGLLAAWFLTPAESKHDAEVDALKVEIRALRTLLERLCDERRE